MAEMWYYTCEGKQMEPVPIPDLKRLVGEGVLKPTDMVWKDGLPRWIRASSLKELFPDPSSSLDHYFSKPAEAKSVAPAPVSTPAPRTSVRPRPEDEEEEARPQRRRRRSADEDDEDRDRPRRRRPAPSSGGSGTLILVLSLVGGFIILASLVIGIIILAAPRGDRRPQQRPIMAAPMPAPLEAKVAAPVPPPPADLPKADAVLPMDVKTGNGVLPMAVNLAPGEEHIVKFRVKANHRASITVTPLPVKGKIVDLNLQVFKDADNALVVADETPKSSARVNFALPATEVVRVRIHNASKNATVTQFTLVYNVGN